MLVNYENKELATVYIETESGAGSGFLISDDGICFTCFHVIKDAHEIYVRILNEKGVKEVWMGSVIYGDEEHDYAILKLNVDHPTYYFELETNISTVKTGDDVALFGFPFGCNISDSSMELEPSLTKGYVASRNKIHGQNCLFLDIRSCPGNSGGPAFCIKTGKVIGYLCGAFGDSTSNIIFVRTLEDFLSKLE